jgi:hypothetical protein
VLLRRIAELSAEFEEVRDSLMDRNEREVRWEALLRCVSEFEAMAKDIRDILLNLRLMPERSKMLSSVSFQRISDAADALKTVWGIDLFRAIDPNDRLFLVKMFYRRHVFTHNGGVVDEEYLERSADVSVRLGEKLRLRSNEIQRLLPLIGKLAQNLFSAFEVLLPHRDGKFVRVQYRHIRLVEQSATGQAADWQ